VVHQNLEIAEVLLNTSRGVAGIPRTTLSGFHVEADQNVSLDEVLRIPSDLVGVLIDEPVQRFGPNRFGVVEIVAPEDLRKLLFDTQRFSKRCRCKGRASHGVST
jgi:hypothetical protein